MDIVQVNEVVSVVMIVGIALCLLVSAMCIRILLHLLDVLDILYQFGGVLSI